MNTNKYLLFFLSFFIIINTSSAFVKDTESTRLITLQVNQKSLYDIFQEITTQTGLRFSYSPQVFDSSQKISVVIQNIGVEEALLMLLPSGVSFKQLGNHIIIIPAEHEVLVLQNEETNNNDPSAISYEVIPPAQYAIDVNQRDNKLDDEKISGLVTQSVGGGLSDNPYVNIQSFNLEDINTLEINYTMDNIFLYESETEKLILREYLHQREEEHYAWVRQTHDKLTIKNGKRFLVFGNSARIEVFIPRSYTGKIHISNMRGNVQSEIDLTAGELIISNVAGDILLETVEAKKIDLKTATGKIDINEMKGNSVVNSMAGRILISKMSGEVLDITNVSAPIELDQVMGAYIILKNTAGKINANKLEGNVTASTMNGTIQLNDITGSGNLVSTIGSIIAYFSRVDKDIVLKTTTGSVLLTLPKDLSFHFQANSKSGNITTIFNEEFILQRDFFKIEVGDTPDLQVEITTTSGNIEVSQK